LRQPMRAWLAVVVLWIAAFAVGGCSEYGARAAAGADTVAVTLPTNPGGTARLFLYRVTASKTGERLGVGRSFRVGEGRQVRAVLQVEGLKPASPLHLHLMWINPDGKKAYTKEVQLRPEDWTRDDRRRALASEMVALDPQRGSVELESRYGISPARIEEELHKPEDSRTFKTGTWIVRAYLFRELLLETSFELLPEEAGTPATTG